MVSFMGKGECSSCVRREWAGGYVIFVDKKLIGMFGIGFGWCDHDDVTQTCRPLTK